MSEHRDDTQMARAADRCPVCDGSPRVLIAVAHPAMRRLILELLEREHGCWTACPLETELAAAVHNLDPDLVVIDGANFPRCCRDDAVGFPCARIVVIGPEPDDAYMAAALHQGAGGWVARDDVADELSAAMRGALGCTHGPCPTPAVPSAPTCSVEVLAE